MRIRLFLLGKTRRPELRVVFDDYLKRLGHQLAIESLEFRDGAALTKKLETDRPPLLILLDDGGKTYTSTALAQWIRELRDGGTREIVFLCGDANGFPDEVRARAHRKLALSAMTYSHELARVMLAEQLYRAFAIISGSPYPR